MARHKTEVSETKLRSLVGCGIHKKDIAKELGISLPTLSKRIAELRSKEGPLMQYREVQSLQLTEIQARILEAITPDRIESASLLELVRAYKILADKQAVLEGKPEKITGLLGLLVKLEAEEVEV